MRSRLVSLSIILLFTIPTIALAEDAESILQKVHEKQVERWKGVDSYVVDQSTGGNRTQIYYQRIDVKGDDGRVYPTFRRTSKQEIEGRRSGGAGVTSMSPAELEAYAQAAEMSGQASAKEIEKGLREAGLPPGLLASSGSDPWASFDPRIMMGGAATFARGAAASEGKAGSEAAARAGSEMAEFAKAARLVGKEKVGGRKAFHLRADDLGRTQKSGGQEFTLQSVSLWIDTKEYVPLRFQMNGIAKSGKETRPLSIEKLDSDYRTVPGTNLYESYRQEMRIGGMLDAKQRAQMKEAQEKMKDFEAQMAQMPASQRDMIMSQMGPQMEMMKKMADGGGFETVTEVHEIRVED